MAVSVLTAGLFWSQATRFCPRKWGPRKGAKGDERSALGGPCHIARRDIERGRDAIRRGMSKRRATAIFNLSLRVGQEWARETREKTRKGMRGVGWEAHVTSQDPTLDAVGTHSCAIRRGMSKKRAKPENPREIARFSTSEVLRKRLLSPSRQFLFGPLNVFVGRAPPLILAK
jgi:hypothetical protein